MKPTSTVPMKETATGGEVTTLTESDFKAEVLDSTVPVLVEFWAQWCGPCRKLAPILEEIARGYGGRLKVVKLNVEDSGNIASRYMVLSLPTLILFKDGKPVERMVGLQGKEVIIDKVEEALR